MTDDIRIASVSDHAVKRFIERGDAGPMSVEAARFVVRSLAAHGRKLTRAESHSRLGFLSGTPEPGEVFSFEMLTRLLFVLVPLTPASRRYAVKTVIRPGIRRKLVSCRLDLTSEELALNAKAVPT